MFKMEVFSLLDGKPFDYHYNGFFEEAIESWPEWDLNPLPLNNSVQML